MPCLEYFNKKDCIEVGIDEAGRGPYAGPVVAAAVIWPCEKVSEMDIMIQDSKKVSEKNRRILVEYIKNNAVAWEICFVDNHVIDDLNILNATYKAMHDCLDKMNIYFDHIIVDGNRFKKYKDIDHTCVVKGDSKYISIAAASILAKEARDEYMRELSKQEKYNMYGWERNMGYGTQEHRDAIAKYGLCDMHRWSFKI